MSATTKTEEELQRERDEVWKRYPPLTEEQKAMMTPEQRYRRAAEIMLALEGKFNIELDIDELRGRRR